VSQLMCQDSEVTVPPDITGEEVVSIARSERGWKENILCRQSDCVKESVDDNWIELSASTTLNFGYNFRDGHC